MGAGDFLVGGLDFFNQKKLTPSAFDEFASMNVFILCEARKHYFLHEFIVTRNFFSTAMLLRSLKPRIKSKPHLKIMTTK